MLCYGRHTNLELLVHYGFVLPPGANLHDVALLPLHVLPPTLLQQLKAGGATASSEAYVFESGAPSWALLRAARLAGASAEERREGAHLALDDRPISEGSERAAMHSLRDACVAALASFPTSVEEDEALLLGLQPEEQLSECGRVAVQWRLGQKMTLQRGVQLAERMLAVLEWRQQRGVQQQGVQQSARQPAAAGLAALVRRPKLT